MQRRKFSREFKLEAVRLVKARGVAVAQAARDLAVHENVLRKWVRELSMDPQHAFPGRGQMKPEQQEIDRLRKEVAKLKAERDILKKAAVDSTDECNMMRIVCIRRIRNGANGSPWLVVAAKARAMGTMESGSIAQ